MASRRLQNYLRTYRKRSGLSQDEIAYLLGCRGSSKVSRCEGLRRVPRLETALAFEIIFQTPVRDLFKGLSETAERRLMRRVGLLARKLQRSRPSPMNEYKLDALAAIVRSSSARSRKHR